MDEDIQKFRGLGQRENLKHRLWQAETSGRKEHTLADYMKIKRAQCSP